VLTVALNNLPLNALMLDIAFSNTSSPFGPLPFDLGLLGAPGCFGRVRPDLTLVVLGANNAATANIGIPSIPTLLGAQFFAEGLVVDPPATLLVLVTSDAAAAIIGN